MSHFETGPLAGYNSLTDPHLAGYFSNRRIRRHLRKSGLVTRDGHVVSETVYRVNCARREHQKQVRDMIAQAIVHKALDMERQRQVVVRGKLEEVAKLQAVQHVKDERRRKDEDILPLLASLTASASLRRNGHHKNHADDGEQMEELPKKDKKHSQSAEQNHRDQDHEKKRRESRSESAHSDRSHDSSVEKNKLKQSSAARKYPADELDERHLCSLDQGTFYDYNLSRRSAKQKHLQSPYCALPPIIAGLIPSPPRARPKTSAAVNRSRNQRPKDKPRPQTAHRLASALPKCKVTLHYFGASPKRDFDLFDQGDQIIVEQQPFGAGTIIVYRGILKPDSDFQFQSIRNPEYPFSLTLYINGQRDSRLSTCCEFKHKAGSRIGGVHTGHFGLVKVSGGRPCFRCHQGSKGSIDSERSGGATHDERNKKTSESSVKKVTKDSKKTESKSDKRPDGSDKKKMTGNSTVSRGTAKKPHEDARHGSEQEAELDRGNNNDRNSEAGSRKSSVYTSHSSRSTHSLSSSHHSSKTDNSGKDDSGDESSSSFDDDENEQHSDKSDKQDKDSDEDDAAAAADDDKKSTDEEEEDKKSHDKHAKEDENKKKENEERESEEKENAKAEDKSSSSSSSDDEEVDKVSKEHSKVRSVKRNADDHRDDSENHRRAVKEGSSESDKWSDDKSKSHERKQKNHKKLANTNENSEKQAKKEKDKMIFTEEAKEDTVQKTEDSSSSSDAEPEGKLKQESPPPLSVSQPDLLSRKDSQSNISPIQTVLLNKKASSSSQEDDKSSSDADEDVAVKQGVDSLVGPKTRPLRSSEPHGHDNKIKGDIAVIRDEIRVKKTAEGHKKEDGRKERDEKDEEDDKETRQQKDKGEEHEERDKRDSEDDSSSSSSSESSSCSKGSLLSARDGNSAAGKQECHDSKGLSNDSDHESHNTKDKNNDSDHESRNSKDKNNDSDHESHNSKDKNNDSDHESHNSKDKNNDSDHESHNSKDKNNDTDHESHSSKDKNNDSDHESHSSKDKNNDSDHEGPTSATETMTDKKEEIPERSSRPSSSQMTSSAGHQDSKPKLSSDECQELINNIEKYYLNEMMNFEKGQPSQQPTDEKTHGAIASEHKDDSTDDDSSDSDESSDDDISITADALAKAAEVKTESREKDKAVQKAT